MCGRFTLTADMFTIEAYFELESAFEFTPRYNIAPSQFVLAVRNNEDNVRELVPLRWGLIPHWTKEENISTKLINARVETVASKPSFRSAFKRQRCLLVASGFYEWQQIDGKKQPYYIYPVEQELLAIAGLWEFWQQDEQTIESCSLITTEANASVSYIHSRMPVLLNKNEFNTWLDRNNQNVENISTMLNTHQQPKLSSHPVSTTVNNPRIDIKDCILPLNN